MNKQNAQVSRSCGGFFGRALCLLAIAASTAGAQTISVSVNRGDYPTTASRPIDGWLRTNGTLIVAMNLGSATNQTRGPGAGIPFTGITGGNPAGPNWSTVGASVDGNLGGFGAGIDPVFFSEIYGASPVTLTYSNLNPARAYVVQILHGEPRATAAGVFTNNQFTSKLPGGASGPTALVPQFRIGNSIASENPPNSNDLALVTAQLSGITSFTYVMRSATNNTRGPSIAGFQVRALPLTHVVTTAADSGAGSLRQALSNAASGDVIVFTNTLSGQTILLTNGILFVAKNLNLDGSALANGMTLSGHGLAPILFVDAGATVVLDSLTLTNGFSTSEGGAILNVGTLTLNRCTVVGNVASNSVAASGGGIVNASTGTLTVNQSTIAGNRVTGNNANGGGIYNLGVSAINQSTVAGNVANGEFGYGGGILNAGGGTLSLFNSIVAGNSASYLGVNIEGSFTALGTNLTAGDPLLAPLGNYGGPTPTMPPLSGSPAIDQCDNSVTNTFATDQRGFLRLSVAKVDIGAVEAVISGPVVATRPATTVTPTGAMLNATVNPNSTAAAAWFQFGTTTNYGHFSSTNHLAATNAALAVSNLVGGLLPGTLYHFRAVASNALGTGLGADQTFTTSIAAPAVTTLAATAIKPYSATAYSATLNGRVDPGGGTTMAYFEYGLDTNYGSFSLTNTLAATNAVLALANLIESLQPNTLYHYRLVAGNSAGIVAGADLTLQTDRAPRIVTTSADGGAGSLRQAILDSVSGDIILFAASLSGSTILLTNGPLLVTNNLSIDASVLPGGIVIDGNGAPSVFRISGFEWGSVVMTALTVTQASVAIEGALSSSFDLTMNQCTVSGNGTGIIWGNRDGNLVLNQCTVSGNASVGIRADSCDTGAVYLTINQCTVSGNGLGIRSECSVVELNQCTVSGNGLGIHSRDYGFTMNQCTVSGNRESGLFVPHPEFMYDYGYSILNSIIAGNGAPENWLGFGQPLLGGTNLFTGDPMLAPLGDYGGRTLTRPPLTGSPAIDRGSDSATNRFATDQRGLPRLSGLHVDIGAAEMQGAIANDPSVLTGLARLGNGAFQFSFTNLSGANFTVFASTNVAAPFSTWSNLGPAAETPPGSGQFQFTDPQATNRPQRFYQVRSP